MRAPQELLQVLGVLLCLVLAPLLARAQGLNPEDEPIPDIVPTAAVAPSVAPTLTQAPAATPLSSQAAPASERASEPRAATPAPTVARSSARLAAPNPAAPKPIARPLPTRSQSAAATPARAQSTTPTAPAAPGGSAPEDVPIEDQPIPDEPAAAAPGAPNASKAPPQVLEAGKSAQNAASNAEDAPIADALPPPGSAAQGKEEGAGEAMPESPGEVDAWSPLVTFQQDFMRHALAAGVVMALACSMLGLYVVLKRIVFVGIALAEVSSTGIALAILLGFSPLLGALGFMVLGVTLLSIHWSRRRVPHESFIGIIFSIAAALSVLFLAKSATGETHMLKLLQGDVLTVSPGETRQMLVAFALVALLHAVFAKEFLMVSFDRDAASTLGFRSGAWDYLLFLTIGLTIALSIRAVGVLVTSTMLTLPAVCALLLTSHLRQAWPVAATCGVLPVVAGLHFSFVWDLPTSAVIVLLSFGLLLLSLAWNFARNRS